jgi:hypothetical protein
LKSERDTQNISYFFLFSRPLRCYQFFSISPPYLSFYSPTFFQFVAKIEKKNGYNEQCKALCRMVCRETDELENQFIVRFAISIVTAGTFIKYCDRI